MNEDLPSASSYEKLSLYRLIRTGLGWATLGRMVTMLSGLIGSALLARLLAPDQLGAWLLGFSLLTGAIVLADLGVPPITLREVARSFADGDLGYGTAVFRTSLKLVATSGFVIAVVLAAAVAGTLGAVFSDPLLPKALRVLAPIVLLYSVERVLAETLRGAHAIGAAVLVEGTLTRIVTLLGLSIAWLSGSRWGVESLGWIYVAAAVPSLPLGWFLIRRRLVRDDFRDALSMRALIESGRWTLADRATVHLMTHADLWIVAAFVSASDVALYGVALRVVALVSVPLVLINKVIPPVVSHLHRDGEVARLERVLRATTSLAAIPMLLVVLVLILWGESILALVFGEFYRDSWAVMSVLAVGGVANVWVGSCGVVLIQTGHERVVPMISVGSSILTVVGAILIAPIAGMLGVAVIASGGLALRNGLAWYAVRHLLGIRTDASFGELFREVSTRMRAGGHP